MQPHSMCAVALTGYLWNNYDKEIESKYTMRVEYYNRYGDYISHSYDLTDIKESADKHQLKIRIQRSGGGLSCVINVRRSSVSEGSKVEMIHETIHVSGLREEYKLYKTSVSEGKHYNSMRYRNFAGHFGAEKKKLALVCEIKRDDGSFYSAAYKLEID